MREILFRGKVDATDDSWVYGCLVKVGEYCCILEVKDDILHPCDYTYLNKDTGCIDGYLTPVDPKTVGQWTGLVDKNGTKIFEGDIVDTKRWYVRYLPDFDGDYGMAAGWYLQRDNFESWEELEINDEHEVLGNIYDNPELLEKCMK